MNADVPRPKTLLSKSLRGRGTTYYLDVRLTKTDQPFLAITTSRPGKENEKPERQSIFIFSHDLEQFIPFLTESLSSVEDVLGSSDSTTNKVD